jgi:hypothetical protein
VPFQANDTGCVPNADLASRARTISRKKFQTSWECFAANEVGKVLMVEVRAEKVSFGAGLCTIFDGETPFEGIAVLVRGQATYKTILRQDEAVDWLLRQGCPTERAADLVEEALRRRTHRIISREQ